MTTTLRSWVLVHNGRVPTTNKILRMHWREWYALRDEWKKAFWALALAQRLPHLDRIAVEVRPSVRDNRPPDPDAAALVAKAALDGLVAAKVVPDDGRGQVAYVRLWDPETHAVDRFTLEVVEIG